MTTTTAALQFSYFWPPLIEGQTTFCFRRRTKGRAVSEVKWSFLWKQADLCICKPSSCYQKSKDIMYQLKLVSCVCMNRKKGRIFRIDTQKLPITYLPHFYCDVVFYSTNKKKLKFDSRKSYTHYKVSALVVWPRCFPLYYHFLRHEGME